MLKRTVQTFQDYPRSFWLMIVVNFIDQLGASLIIPFFALYVTERFGIGMSQVGALFAVYGIASFLGAFPGGALADRFGRRGIIIFGLVASSFSRVLMAAAGTYGVFVAIAFAAGMCADISRPVYESVFMDILSPEKRASGFGIRRVAYNVAIVAGPVIGGFVARRSYLMLFIASAVTCALAGLIVFLSAPETRPTYAKGQTPESIGETFAGYLKILGNGRFMAFVGASLLAWLIYVNMSTTLGVYLRNRFSVPESFYGLLLSLNAGMVVLFQFTVAQWTGKRPMLLMMSLGAIFFAIGLGMYGFVSTYILFGLAMVIITIGELIALPVSTTLVAAFAPENMRGRYNFIFYDSWVIAYAVGPFLAGRILDSANPNMLWISCAGLGVVTAIIFLALHSWLHAAVLSSVPES